MHVHVQHVHVHAPCARACARSCARTVLLELSDSRAREGLNAAGELWEAIEAFFEVCGCEQRGLRKAERDHGGRATHT